MNRRKFIGIAGGAVVATGATGYLLSDKSNLKRSDLSAPGAGAVKLMPEEQEILFLASLAPSGHNTQPWFIQYLEPFRWIIGNDKSKWLPAVDPTQRETVLSIGAFLQNLEYAAASLGYDVSGIVLAATNQDERVAEVKLTSIGTRNNAETDRMTKRRTMRSPFQTTALRAEDVTFISDSDSANIRYLPVGGKEHGYLNEQTIEANRIQTYRDPAQQELADWIRFSSKSASQHRDGLTTASMEIEGLPGWIVRNFYGPKNVMGSSFREQGLDKIRAAVAGSAGWILVTSPDESVISLLVTGRRMQRLFLKVRERNIALQPMTQILEEPATRAELNRSVGIGESIQFILRVGYVNNYSPPVSLRRPVEWFVRK